MRILLSSLNHYLSTPLSAQEAAHTLESLGHEIEAIRYLGEGLDTVLVGQIVEHGRHPNADRLFVTQVDLGTRRTQIITAATNPQLGDRVPVALPGTNLPDGKQIGLTNMRGIESHGMFCSLEEFGLAAKSEGVHVLPAEAPLGVPAYTLLGLDDWLLEVASTPNRGDCLSAYGLAREIAAAGGNSVKPPLDHNKVLNQADTALTAYPIVNEAPDMCHQYLGALVEGVTIGPSPLWLRSRLHLLGMRSVNNVVDVTNLVLMELGQPLHAFDAAKLAGQKIVVRRARAGETMQAIDGSDLQLDDTMLVIADAERPQALAGVMGALASEVSDATTRIFLEGAHFHPVAVRRAARKTGLRSESSSRFERGIDPAGVLPAVLRAIELFTEVASAQRYSPLQDAWGDRVEPPVVTLRPDRVNRVLGTEFPAEKIDAILHQLGFQPQDGGYRVPTWRLYDTTREIDLIEEVARTAGYDQIPSTLPSRRSEGALSPSAAFARQCRRYFTGAGLDEVMTYSLAAAEQVAEETAIALANPLTADLTHLRTSLLPNHLEVLKHNLDRGIRDVHIFEIGKQFNREDGQIKEQTVLSALLYGSRWQGVWKEPPANLQADFYYVKGLLEGLFEQLNLASVQWEALTDCPTFHPGRAARVLLDGEPVAFVGELHPRLAEPYVGSDRVAYFDCDFERLQRAIAAAPANLYRPVSRFPAAQRDVALAVPDHVSAAQVLAEVAANQLEHLESVRIFDVYKGGNLPPEFKSLAFSLTLRHAQRTLTEQEIETSVQQVKDRLAAQLGAILR